MKDTGSPFSMLPKDVVSLIVRFLWVDWNILPSETSFQPGENK